MFVSCLLFVGCLLLVGLFVVNSVDLDDSLVVCLIVLRAVVVYGDPGFGVLVVCGLVFLWVAVVV